MNIAATTDCNVAKKKIKISQKHTGEEKVEDITRTQKTHYDMYDFNGP